MQMFICACQLREPVEFAGLLAYSPLAGGSLSGKYQKDGGPKNSRFNLFPGALRLSC